jgi:gas vesicle protein
MGKKLFKGALFGGLFGAGLLWMFRTKKGRQLKNRLLEHSNSILKEVLKRIPENDWVDQKKVERVLGQVMGEYSHTKQLAGAAKKLVTKEVKKQLKKRTKK